MMSASDRGPHPGSQASTKCETKFDITEPKDGLALIQFGGKRGIKMIDLAVPKSAEST